MFDPQKRQFLLLFAPPAQAIPKPPSDDVPGYKPDPVYVVTVNLGKKRKHTSKSAYACVGLSLSLSLSL